MQLYAGVLNSNEVAFLYANPGVPVANVAAASTGLAAYYDFDENTARCGGPDGHGNNLIYAGSFSGPVLSTNAVSGSGAAYFNGGSFLTPRQSAPTLAGDFSLSLWVDTPRIRL